MKRRISVPGKSVLAGEYAVLEAGFHCLVAGINRRLTVSVEPAEIWSIDTGAFRWSELDPVTPEVRFVVGVIELARSELQLTPHLITTSDELSTGEHKLGLGGSAAATVGTIAALWPPETEPLQIAAKGWKLHRKLQSGRGSGADVIAATLGNVQFFRTRGEDFEAQLQPVHSAVRFDLVWTGMSVQTTPRLQIWADFASSRPQEAAMFCKASEDAVTTLASGLQFGDIQTMRSGMKAARHALRLLERLSGLPIETEVLRVASDVATSAGGAAKLSGAGGGDCAIVLTVGDRQREQVTDRLRKEGLEVIPVEVATDGVREEVADEPSDRRE